jgi:hypothetical protein
MIEFWDRQEHIRRQEEQRIDKLAHQIEQREKKTAKIMKEISRDREDTNTK